MGKKGRNLKQSWPNFRKFEFEFANSNKLQVCKLEVWEVPKLKLEVCKLEI